LRKKRRGGLRGGRGAPNGDAGRGRGKVFNKISEVSRCILGVFEKGTGKRGGSRTSYLFRNQNW